MEGEGFFNTMRGEMVNVFFNNPRVWAVAGWEGASYDKGGYYLRGFQMQTGHNHLRMQVLKVVG